MYKSVYLLFDVFFPVFCLEMILETVFFAYVKIFSFWSEEF